MRQLTWAVTWIMVGLATTLATANVLTHIAQLHRAPPAAFQAPPPPDPGARPGARARTPGELGRSVTPAGFHQHDPE